MTWYAPRRIIKNGKVRRLVGRFVPGTRIRLAMKYILRYFSAYKKETVLAPLFKMIETLFELTVPLVVADMIDRGIGGDRAVLSRGFGILFALGIAGLACAVTAQYFAAKTAVGVAKKTRAALFERITQMSWKQLDETGSATLLTRMTSDVNQVQTGINLTLRLFLRSPFIVFGAVIMAFTVDVRSGVLFLCVLPLLAAVVFGIMLGGIPLYRRVQNHLDGVTERARENLGGVRVIRAFGMEQTEIDAFDRKNGELLRAQKHAGRVAAFMNPLTYVIINVAIAFLIYTGYLRFSAGTLSRGQIIALYNYMSQILVELVKLANLIITMTRAAACAGRIGSVLSEEGEPDVIAGGKTATDREAAVSFRDVSVRYHAGGDPALTGVTFAAGKGETVGIIGGTGSGKSTLISLIGRYYLPESGEVSVFGRPVEAWDRSELRASVGYVPQKAILFRGTVRDNLLMGCPDATDNDLWQALEAAQAADFVRSKDGLDTRVEQGGRNLSGGQKQRLTIARALVGKKPILIFDDSASALDYATDAALRRALAALDWHPTIFIVSQRTASIRHADRILVLEDGEPVGVGTHDELLDTCPVYAEINRSQYQEDAAK